MNYTLVSFVVLYLLGTLALGVWAGTRIKNTADFAIAGRSLPLIMVVTTTFATWFGAETVMGIPAKFVQGGLNADRRRPVRRRHLPDPGGPVLRRQAVQAEPADHRRLLPPALRQAASRCSARSPSS